MREAPLSVVREGDSPTGDYIHESSRVLEKVRGFAVKMNVRRTYSREGVAWLLRWCGVVAAPAREVTDPDAWVVELMSDDVFHGTLQRCRAQQGVGYDGFRCVLLRWAPEWAQRLYLRALRAVVLHDAFPDEWRKWFVIMIPKAGKDPSIFAYLRDVWLVPHGWKLVTGCFQHEYQRVNEAALPHYAHGFRVTRNAAQASLVTRLQTEAAASACVMLVRAFFDLKGFFMGVVRTMLLEMERQMGVFPGITRAVQGLQGAATGSVDTAHGLTEPFACPDGTGQGCKLGPDRALLTLLPMQAAVGKLVLGWRVASREHPRQREAALQWGDERRIAQTWFADDQTQYPADAFQLQHSMDVTDCAAFVSGHELGVDAKATKTAWSIACCDAKGGLDGECGGRYEIHLPRGDPLPSPRVPGAYKTLGCEADVRVGNTETRERVVHRSGSMFNLVGTVAGLERRDVDSFSECVVRGVIYFYGRTVPLSWGACERVEVRRRKTYSRLGHRHRRGARVQLYAAVAEGGYGVTHAYAHAGAVLIDQVDIALSEELGSPDRLAVEGEIANTAVRLGYVPSVAEPTPLDWHS